jgi:hypothetical protein
VIRNSPLEHVVFHLDSLVNRLLKHLSQPSCLSRAAVVNTVAVLVETTRQDSIPYIPAISSSMMDSLVSTDWNARKAGAEGLAKIARCLQSGMAGFKETILSVLEEARFDKVFFRLDPFFFLSVLTLSSLFLQRSNRCGMLWLKLFRCTSCCLRRSRRRKLADQFRLCRAQAAPLAAR